MMVLAVIIVVAVVGGGLVRGSTYIKECNPAEYDATRLAPSVEPCGFVDSGLGPERVYCEEIIKIIEGVPVPFADKCMDAGKNKCCPIVTETGYDWYVEVIGNRCCKVTVL